MKRLSIIALSAIGLTAGAMTAMAQAADRPNGPPEGERPSPEQMLQRLDADKDGKISKAEAPERMAENFDRRDTDGDGFLTKEELAAPPAGGGRQGGQ